MKPQLILIADDDEKVLSLLSSSLQKSGYITSLAYDGVEAYEQATTKKPDLILADIMMPRMNGFEFCKQIRENPDTMDIPFIFLTAKGELNDRVSGLNLGADDYISKPFHISEVTARIKAILQRAGSVSDKGADESETALKGNLEQMNMAELFQTLNMGKKTGGLKIISNSMLGKIYFDNGNITQALLGRYKNEEAVYRMVAWEVGYFEFDAADKSGKAVIATTTTSLLLEGFRQRDDYLKYKEVLPVFEAIVKVSDAGKIDESKPASQKVLALIDGKRSIQEIMDMSPINYLLTLKILYTLIKKNIIAAVESQPNQGIDDQDFGELAQELYD